jgi:cellulose synthase/poly-beta-1,6-N-acetylglucosamine synthase-like glycosyltransferase
MIILQLFIFIITTWLGLSVIYMLIYAVSGLFYKSEVVLNNEIFPTIAVLIPAYKEDAVIVSVAKKALEQNYQGSFEIFVIADSLKLITLIELSNLSISIIEVTFKKSTKAKALNYAMHKIGDEYDIAMILDADNVMANNVLSIMASKFIQGSQAIQGHRCAKNQNTNFALLDGISEEVNNNIYCKGPAALNLSSRLVGSGMSFHYPLFKRLMKTIDAIGGFDKELELKIIKEGITIEYLDSALIYDEKVSQSQVFEKQRTRWISAQYHYMFKVMPNAFKELLNGNFDYFYKAYQLTLPPRLLLPGVLLIFSIIFYVIGQYLFATTWSTLFILNVIAYTISIPAKYWTKELWRGSIALPLAFFITLKAMLNLGGANKKFIHTPHSNSDSLN